MTQLIENEDEGKHIFESVLQIMLSYVKFGEIKYGDEPLSDERIQSVFGLITDIDSALMSKSGKDRLNVVNMVLVRCWDYIESFCEECKKRQEEAEAPAVPPVLQKPYRKCWERLPAVLKWVKETAHRYRKLLVRQKNLRRQTNVHRPMQTRE